MGPVMGTILPNIHGTASFAVLGGWEDEGPRGGGFGVAKHQHGPVLGQRFTSHGGWQEVAPGSPGHPEATAQPRGS